jgi:outer membrane receptor protein involved in Fe transport
MQSWYGDTGLIFYNLHDAVNPFLTVATSDSLAFFLDDQWSPTKRLTVNLGLRFDRMTTKYGSGFEYAPLTAPTDIANPTVLRIRDASENIFDFKTWSPRLGLTYQLTKDAKTVARFSYGRYYLPITVEYLRRYGPDAPLVTRTWEWYSVPWDQADLNDDGFIDTVETRAAARVVGGLTPYDTSTEEPADRFSWRLNTDPNLKDQFTDQFTFSLEREIMKNFSVSGTFILKHSANLFANIPVMRTSVPALGLTAGDEWPYERIPFTTLEDQTVDLYSIEWLDYNQDGEINGTDVQWIGNNSDYKVVNMSAFDDVKAKRDFQGYQLVFNKRYSNRWQMLGSFLYTHSSGMANRIYSQSMNFEGPMVTDNNWMSTLNYTINNMTGPLPFTPKFEFKLSGSYTIPGIEVDLGARFRLHTGRPVWQLEGIPQHSQWGNPEGGVIDGGVGTIVSSQTPFYMPTQSILDYRVEKAIPLGSKYGSVHVVLDVFNLFNANTPTDLDYQWEFGKVGGILSPRAFRLSFLYQF